MKFHCIYCTHAWECETRPDACPSCATPFSLTVTPDTSIFDLAMALDRNGRELDFELRARLPEQHPEHMDVTLASAAMGAPLGHAPAHRAGLLRGLRRRPARRREESAMPWPRGADAARSLTW